MTAKKYTVKEFCKKYNDTNVEQTKEALIKSIMNNHYVSYEMKLTICKKIIDNTYYKEVERNNSKIKELHVNSPMKYMLYCLYLISSYTLISVDFTHSLEEFNLLNKSGIFDFVIAQISEKERKEFNMILEMVENDLFQNEYETHAFISKQINRFGELFGTFVSPGLDKLNETIKTMDIETIDNMSNKIKKILKFNK